MKTIAILSRKGGSGKTTLAVHLAVAASHGRRTAILDIDPQATAARWGDRRALGDPKVVSGQASRLPQLIEDARARKAALLFLDTAPNASDDALEAAEAADLILIPCRPAAFDLSAIQSTLKMAAQGKAKAFVVLNAVPARGSEAEAALATLKRQGAIVAPCSLGQRIAFRHGVTDGRTAQEFEPGGKAAREVEALFAWVCGQVGLTSTQRPGRAA